MISRYTRSFCSFSDRGAVLALQPDCAKSCQSRNPNQEMDRVIGNQKMTRVKSSVVI